MTYSKLALRNARRQAKDYLVYFVTVVMAAALLYSFNGLIFSQEILTLAQGMSSLPLTIVLASIVVVCVFGWLVSYTTTFMLKKRSRELGTYILIGLEHNQVARLFFLENLAAGCCALVLGILLGGVLYQMLRVIILNLFEIPYRFSLPLFSVSCLTCAYFILIYLYALYKSRRQIRQMQIRDLIYFERVNQTAVIQSSKVRRKIFAVSIVLGIAGTLLLMAGDITLGIIGAACAIAFLFGFFQSFSSGVPAFFEKHPVQKYTGQNLLVFRTLTAKLATMGTLMAIISMIFMATLMSEGSALVFRGIFVNRAAHYSCFDLVIGIYDPANDFAPYLDYINTQIPVESSFQYTVYRGNGDPLTDYIEADGSIRYFRLYDTDPVLGYSDYAALRAMLGYPEVSLEPGSFLLHCMPYLEPTLQTYRQPVSIEGTTLTPGGIYTEPLYQYAFPGNGEGFILVVPDELAKGLSPSHRIYAAMTKTPLSTDQFAALSAICNDDPRAAYDSLHCASNEKTEAAMQTAVMVFPLFYLALALTMTAATILTIQQLSESDHYRFQFALLHKLGMDRRDMQKALRTLFAVYYAMPAIPALLIGIPFIHHLAALVEPGILVESNRPGIITAITLGLFFPIYALYILLAHSSLKRHVLPD